MDQCGGGRRGGYIIDWRQVENEVLKIEGVRKKGNRKTKRTRRGKKQAKQRKNKKASVMEFYRRLMKIIELQGNGHKRQNNATNTRKKKQEGKIERKEIIKTQYMARNAFEH